jgi:integrase
MSWWPKGVRRAGVHRSAPLVILIGEHSVDRGAAYAERGCDRAGGFAAGVHTPDQLSPRLVKRLGSPDRLAACPTRFACRCLSGLRRGEIAGAKWSDIDYDAGTITIARNRVQVGAATVVENKPKTQSSHRTLPLDAGLVGVLKRASARYAREKFALGAAHADSGYIAVNEAGEP